MTDSLSVTPPSNPIPSLHTNLLLSLIQLLSLSMGNPLQLRQVYTRLPAPDSLSHTHICRLQGIWLNGHGKCL